MLNIHQESAIATKTADLKLVYSKYASMLLGYLVEATNDRKQAEDYLVKIYTELAAQLNSNPQEMYSWTQLRQFALKFLRMEPNTVSIPGRPAGRQSLGLEHLSASQKEVFLSVYYRGTTISALAVQLNQTEETIRKTLKEAFALMKGTREN